MSAPAIFSYTPNVLGREQLPAFFRQVPGTSRLVALQVTPGSSAQVAQQLGETLSRRGETLSRVTVAVDPLTNVIFIAYDADQSQSVIQLLQTSPNLVPIPSLSSEPSLTQIPTKPITSVKPTPSVFPTPSPSQQATVSALPISTLAPIPTPAKMPISPIQLTRQSPTVVRQQEGEIRPALRRLIQEQEREAKETERRLKEQEELIARQQRAEEQQRAQQQKAERERMLKEQQSTEQLLARLEQARKEAKLKQQEEQRRATAKQRKVEEEKQKRDRLIAEQQRKALEQKELEEQEEQRRAVLAQKSEQLRQEKEQERQREQARKATEQLRADQERSEQTQRLQEEQAKRLQEAAAEESELVPASVFRRIGISGPGQTSPSVKPTLSVAEELEQLSQVAPSPTAVSLAPPVIALPLTLPLTTAPPTTLPPLGQQTSPTMPATSVVTPAQSTPLVTSLQQKIESAASNPRGEGSIPIRQFFETITGVTERELVSAYQTSPAFLNQIKRQNVLQASKLGMGSFEIRTVGELENLVQPILAAISSDSLDTGTFNVREGVGTDRLNVTSWYLLVDIMSIQAEPANSGALFQVASNFNALETRREDETLQIGNGQVHWLENYPTDLTQGPAASISAAPGLIKRRYYAFESENPQDPTRWPQTENRYINLLDNLSDYFTRVSSSGYAVVNPQIGYPDPNVYRQVKILLHKDISVAFGLRVPRDTNPLNDQIYYLGPGPANNQKVHQVFSAALDLSPGGVNASIANSENVQQLAKHILAASYFGVLYYAILNSFKRVFLTLVGGGVFNNDPRWIIDILSDKIYKTLIKRAGLEVTLIWYGSSTKPQLQTSQNLLRDRLLQIVRETRGQYQQFSQQYPKGVSLQ